MERNLSFEIWFSVGVILLFIGILGNCLTVLSIIVPKIRKRHGFDDTEWLSSTVFVVNLASADIIYCLFKLCVMVHGVLVYQKYNLGNPTEVCKFFIFGIQDLGSINGWCIALIAVTHAIPKIKYVFIRLAEIGGDKINQYVYCNQFCANVLFFSIFWILAKKLS